MHQEERKASEVRFGALFNRITRRCLGCLLLAEISLNIPALRAK
jgi:hypothetical protein